MSSICSCNTALIILIFNEQFKQLKSGVILGNAQKRSFNLSYHRYVFCMDEYSAGYFFPHQKKEANRLLPENAFAGKRRMSLDSQIN